MSEYVLDRYPDNMSSRTQDKMSNQMSESPKSIPGILDRMQEYSSDKMWEHMLEYMSDRASQYVPDRMSYRREECVCMYIYIYAIRC